MIFFHAALRKKKEKKKRTQMSAVSMGPCHSKAGADNIEDQTTIVLSHTD